MAGSENSAAKISAGDPASALGVKRNPGGQNQDPAGIHGGERKSQRPKSQQDPAGNPVGSRQDSRRGTEILAAKISAGPGGNPGGIPPRSCEDPGGFFTRVLLGNKGLWPKEANE